MKKTHTTAVQPPRASPPLDSLQVAVVAARAGSFTAAAHDSTARWRAFLSRWQNEFPDLSDSCRRAMPMLERCYGQMISDLTERLGDQDSLDNDFAVQEFLDRYGMRLAQLGTILNLVAPLAEAGPPQGESA